VLNDSAADTGRHHPSTNASQMKHDRYILKRIPATNGMPLYYG
jgi:hypothetical protein